MNKATKDQIRNVLIIISSAMAFGGAFAAYMILSYGPSGQYIAGNTILSPYIINDINYLDKQENANEELKFVYEGTEYSYFDKQKNQLQKKKISYPHYEQFYQMVAAEKSIDPVPEDIETLFLQRDMASLLISMRANNTELKNNSMIFQVIQITPQGYFRVQLRNKNNAWAYFYYPKLYDNLLSLFNQ